jgi:hypothetical protein
MAAKNGKYMLGALFGCMGRIGSVKKRRKRVDDNMYLYFANNCTSNSVSDQAQLRVFKNGCFRLTIDYKA